MTATPYTYDDHGNPTTPPRIDDPDASAIRVHVDGGSPGGYPVTVTAWGSSDAPAGVYVGDVLAAVIARPNAPDPYALVVDAAAVTRAGFAVVDVWRVAADAFGRMWSAAVGDGNPTHAPGADPAAYVVRRCTAANVLDHVDAERFGDVSPDVIAADALAVVVPASGYPDGYVVGIVGPGGPAPTVYYVHDGHDPAAIVAAARAWDADGDACPACGYGPMPSNPAATRAATVRDGVRPCPTCGRELDPDVAADGRAYVVRVATDADVAATPIDAAAPDPGDVAVVVPASGYPTGRVVAIIDRVGGRVWVHPDHDDGAADAAAGRWRMDHASAWWNDAPTDDAARGPSDDPTTPAGWTSTVDAVADTPGGFGTPAGRDLSAGRLPVHHASPHGPVYMTVRGTTAADVAALRDAVRAGALYAPADGAWTVHVIGDDVPDALRAFALSVVFVVDGDPVAAVATVTGGGIPSGPVMCRGDVDRDVMRRMTNAAASIVDVLAAAGGFA